MAAFVPFTGTGAERVTTVADGVCLAGLDAVCSFLHVLSSLLAMRLRPLPSSEALYLALPFFST